MTNQYFAVWTENEIPLMGDSYAIYRTEKLAQYYAELYARNRKISWKDVKVKELNLEVKEI